MEVEGYTYASVNKTIVDQCQSSIWKNADMFLLNPLEQFAVEFESKYNYIQLKWTENATSKLVAIMSWSQCVKDEELIW